MLSGAQKSLPFRFCKWPYRANAKALLPSTTAARSAAATGFGSAPCACSNKTRQGTSNDSRSFMRISLRKWEHSRRRVPLPSVDHRSLSAVFLRQVVLYQTRFLCGEDAIIHQNLTDFAVEKSVADARTDCALTGCSTKHRQLARAALHQQIIHVQAVGAVVMHCAGSCEVLSDAAGTGVEKSIACLRGPEACIHVGLVGAHEGIARGFVFCPGNRAVPRKGVGWSIGVCRFGNEKDGHLAPTCYGQVEAE